MSLFKSEESRDWLDWLTGIKGIKPEGLSSAELVTQMDKVFRRGLEDHYIPLPTLLSICLELGKRREGPQRMVNCFFTLIERILGTMEKWLFSELREVVRQTDELLHTAIIKCREDHLQRGLAHTLVAENEAREKCNLYSEMFHELLRKMEKARGCSDVPTFLSMTRKYLERMRPK